MVADWEAVVGCTAPACKVDVSCVCSRQSCWLDKRFIFMQFVLEAVPVHPAINFALVDLTVFPRFSRLLDLGS